MRWTLIGVSSAMLRSRYSQALERVALGVARREFAAGVAGAGDEARAKVRGLGGQADLRQRRAHARPRRRGDVGDDQALPHGEPDRSAAEAARDVGDAAHLRAGHASQRQRHAAVDPSGLASARWKPTCASRLSGGRGSHSARRQARQRRGQPLLDRGEKRLVPHAVEHVLQPRALAVGAVALVDEDAHDRQRDRHALLRQDRHAEIAGEIAVPGNAADRDAKIDALGHAPARGHAYRARSRCRWCPRARTTAPPPSKAMLNLRGSP